MMRPRVGDRVRVTKDDGVHSGKEGTLIPKKDIPVSEEGVPLLPGHTAPLQLLEVGIKQDDGNLFVMSLNRLDKVG